MANTIIALETELGINPAGTLTDVKSFLQIEHNTDGTKRVSSRFATDTGSADTYAVAPTPAWTGYTKGAFVIFDAANASTGASTLNVSALGTKTILKFNDQAIASGDIEAGQMLICVYDGTNFQMISPGGHATAGLDVENTFTKNLTISTTSGSALLDIEAIAGQSSWVRFVEDGTVQSWIGSGGTVDESHILDASGAGRVRWDLSGSDGVLDRGIVPLARIGSSVLDSSTAVAGGGTSVITIQSASNINRFYIRSIRGDGSNIAFDGAVVTAAETVLDVLHTVIQRPSTSGNDGLRLSNGDSSVSVTVSYKVYDLTET